MKRIYGVEGQIVHWSNIAREYKGAGFGAFLYDTLLYKYGVLESDSILYQGSRAMWSKHIPKVASFFGGTSMLIGVGVILDTLQQVESYLLMNHYDGLMKTGRITGRTVSGTTGGTTPSRSVSV
jgi:hypothetical protein